MIERNTRFIYPSEAPRPPSRLDHFSYEQRPIQNPWIALHDGTVFDAKSLADWELSIPQYGCQCKAFYRAWKAENAPDFSSPEDLFAWGVRLHNAVNAKLGKPQITLEEAYSIWRKDDGKQAENSGTDLS